jgi:cobalt transporter subunit CbtA
MAIFRSIVFSAALAGLIVGLAVTVLQQFGTVPLILKGEVYEKAAESKAVAQPGALSADGDDHTHPHDTAQPAWEPSDGFERNAYTAVFNVVVWIGFGLLLAGGLVLFRRPMTWREGLLWGLAGFAIFAVAPALGLPPELPGVPAAPLGPRQVWWVATAAATAAGLGLIAFTRSPLAAVAGIALIAAPHLVGAPQLEHLETNVPHALSHQFVVAATLTAFVAWALLGGLTACLGQRFGMGHEPS